MLNKSKRPPGFSLVELVIVIVILGVIAAVAIPRISSGSKNAGESALRANLATLRNAIDWYYSEHANTFPSANGDGGAGAAGSVDALVNQLTMYTNAAGQVVDTKDATHPYGPYLRNGFPKLPVGANAGSKNVTMITVDGPLTVNPSTAAGWMYSTKTGQIIANVTDPSSDGTAYNTF